MRYHLEQAHSKEFDFHLQLEHFPALPVTKKTKTTKTAVPQNALNRYQAPSPAPNPFFGLFTHGYVFSSTNLPFRPLNRPIDAAYYLNILSTAGIKTHQQRASERAMVNSLLSADFVSQLQMDANIRGLYDLQVLDENNMLKKPTNPIEPTPPSLPGAFSKRDVDSGILKLAKTLQDIGFGDSIQTSEQFF